MDTREYGDPSDILARDLMNAGYSLGKAFAASAKPEAVAGAMVVLELLVPILLTCDVNGLTVKHFYEVLVRIARGVNNAEEAD